MNGTQNWCRCALEQSEMHSNRSNAPAWQHSSSHNSLLQPQPRYNSGTPAYSSHKRAATHALRNALRRSPLGTRSHLSPNATCAHASCLPTKEDLHHSASSKKASAGRTAPWLAATPRGERGQRSGYTRLVDTTKVIHKHKAEPSMHNENRRKSSNC